MSNLKFGFSEYGKPTPKRLRKIGDTLLILSQFVSANFEGNYKAMIIASGLGVLSKLFTNLFAEK